MRMVHQKKAKAIQLLLEDRFKISKKLIFPLNH